MRLLDLRHRLLHFRQKLLGISRRGRDVVSRVDLILRTLAQPVDYDLRPALVLVHASPNEDDVARFEALREPLRFRYAGREVTRCNTTSQQFRSGSNASQPSSSAR